MNSRIIRVSYIPCTNYRQSRVKIEDLRFKEKIIIPLDSIFNGVYDAALDYLQKRGIDFLRSGSDEKYFYFITDNFERRIK